VRAGRRDVWGEGDRGAISSRRLLAKRGYRNKRRADKAETKAATRPPAFYADRGRDRLGKKASGEDPGESIVVISV